MHAPVSISSSSPEIHPLAQRTIQKQNKSVANRLLLLLLGNRRDNKWPGRDFVKISGPFNL